MSMAFALEYGMEWLRSQNNWKPNECGVQMDGLPALDAGAFFISLDDGGIESGIEGTDVLAETLTMIVGIWRRPEHLTRTQRGQLKLPHDKYLLGAYTLHEMERQVIVPRLKGFHLNYDFMNGLNSRYNLPHAQNGAAFINPWMYRGRGRMETVNMDDGSSTGQDWYGYRLRFRGLGRLQKLRSNTDAVG